jgi:class 3 adenylate cyclase
MERRLAAILMADVAGYSRLMGADEVGTLNALKEHRLERIDPAIARHNGRVVRTIGDGLLVEFASVVDAVASAVAIQRAILAFNAGIHVDRQIVLRIGINVGDIIIDGSDIFGDGVNVAARLEALCEPGGICISRYANEQVRDKLRLSFADLGEQRVKNIARAIGVFGLSPSDIAALPEEALLEPEPAVARTPLLRAPRGRTLLIVAGAVILVAILAVGGWWALPSRTLALLLENRNFAAFSGRWVGIWDNNPLYTTSLTIESVSPTGDVTGSYVYWSENHAKFAAKIADNTINFGSPNKFTFRLRPDGKMEGTRNRAGILNTTILSRDAADSAIHDSAFSGRWVGVWDNNPLYTTSLTIESASPTGDVTGTYVYWFENHSKFLAKITDNTINFGSPYKFTFTLRPDGKMEGTRNNSGLLNTTVLQRDHSPIGQ